MVVSCTCISSIPLASVRFVSWQLWHLTTTWPSVALFIIPLSWPPGCVPNWLSVSVFVVLSHPSLRLPGSPHCHFVAQITLSISSDFLPVLLLACTDPLAIVMIQVVDVVHSVEIITAVMLIFMSYVSIVAVILHIQSAEGWRKAFSTCISHLTVFLLFFGSVALMYLCFSATYSLFWDTVIALAFAVFPPFFNPIIYSLRNKEIKEAIKKHWGQAKIFFHKTKDLK